MAENNINNGKYVMTLQWLENGEWREVVCGRYVDHDRAFEAFDYMCDSASNEGFMFDRIELNYYTQAGGVEFLCSYSR